MLKFSGFHLTEVDSAGIRSGAMKLYSKRIAATQFTLYMAVSNLGLAACSGLMGLLKKMVNWQYVIAAYIPFVFVALFLIRFINFDKH